MLVHCWDSGDEKAWRRVTLRSSTKSGTGAQVDKMHDIGKTFGDDFSWRKLLLFREFFNMERVLTLLSQDFVKEVCTPYLGKLSDLLRDEKQTLGPEKLKYHCVNEAVLELFGNSLNFQLAGPTGTCFPVTKHAHMGSKSILG